MLPPMSCTTCATLTRPWPCRPACIPKVVSERLGHATVSITLDTYSHAVPALQEEAAAPIAGLVFATRWTGAPRRSMAPRMIRSVSCLRTPRPAAQALRTRRARHIPLGGVPRGRAGAGEQTGRRGAREGLPAGGTAKRDRGAEPCLTAVVVKQAHMVVEVPLRLQDRAADLAVEGLRGGECGHVAESLLATGSVRRRDCSRRPTTPRPFDRATIYSPSQGIGHPPRGSPGPLTRGFAVALSFAAGLITCQSPLLQAGVHPKVVSERLGHATVSITLDTYFSCHPGDAGGGSGADCGAGVRRGHNQPLGRKRRMCRSAY